MNIVEMNVLLTNFFKWVQNIEWSHVVDEALGSGKEGRALS